MDRLSSLAIENAVKLAKNLGVLTYGPALLKDASNVVIHLPPSVIVARIATSTALVRRDASQYFAREIAVAKFLAEQGAPVVPPSKEVEPGPHIYDGYTVSFWQYVEQNYDATVTVRSAAPVLRELHTALMAYQGELPYLGPIIDEIPRWLRYLQMSSALTSSDMMMLREAHWRIAERLRQSKARPQALHGDAHVKNLLKTPNGLLWTDFEDTCRGPIAWDLACLVHGIARGADSSGFRGVVDAYGRLSGYHLEWGELEPYLDARELQGLVWSQVQAMRFPEKREIADALLGSWRNRI